MAHVSMKSSVSSQRRRFIEQLQNLNFGEIEGLEVWEGGPVFGSKTQVVRDIKLGGENGSRPEPTSDDFELKKEVIAFFAELDRIGNGTVERLEVKYGLPFKMSVTESIRD